MTFDFHPEAETELLEAIAYYESCAPGLGEDFSLEVYSTVQNILSYPHAWPIVEDDVHRCLTSRFPYGVLYSIESDGIYILAVMHLHRRPDYWKHRR
ncbi:MAG: plasmid stabilization protein [Deltaproteobacteria bacterium CG_4_9_14_3_um_filter_44_9]|nr:MAG: plasmid stabilization protein [Deltaproteobacteria bacterium CG06_land_8_20_14_3_00_44_19]PIV02355.1 MAG: plasmid stabilization protein [Syntrophobacterales bacterium CG03_land_8_20_14_0_80_58_14]PJB43389.1 MAG: plasmid stabilization protein [Deltaproteobacteria bacterium CG_4_9_14_3_um_filter_44_9]